MTDNRLERMMEEALSGDLSQEEQNELQEILAQNPEEAQTFDSQLQVDAILMRPPHERAPQRLALTILARIAETARQRETDLSELDEAMLNLAVQLVAVATMPMLIGASYLILNASANPELMDAVLQQIAALLMLVIDTMQVLLEEAQALYEDDPETAMTLLAFIPITLLQLVGQVLGHDNMDDDA